VSPIGLHPPALLRHEVLNPLPQLVTASGVPRRTSGSA